MMLAETHKILLYGRRVMPQSRGPPEVMVTQGERGFLVVRAWHERPMKPLRGILGVSSVHQPLAAWRLAGDVLALRPECQDEISRRFRRMFSLLPRGQPERPYLPVLPDPLARSEMRRVLMIR